jgi:hypothetical protein
MPILDIQRRGQQIGRIRIGQQVSTGQTKRDGSPKMRPTKLDTFRFTTASRAQADAIAELYGGTVREWEGQYEVITRQNAIGVTVPPRDQVVSQWYEMWTKGGCQRRCDSQHEQISNGPCQCPSDPQERARLARLNPPEACKTSTRISVMIPDLPGLGVFRLDTGSYYAASEIGDSAELMQMARDRGIFLPAILRIEQRTRVAGGQTKKYPVPVLEVLATFRDIATGVIEAQGMAAQLPPAPGEERRAITSGPPQPAATPETLRDDDAAQRIADLALLATTRDDLRKLAAKAEAEGLMDEYVCTDKASDMHDQLRACLRDRWQELPEGGESQ